MSDDEVTFADLGLGPELVAALADLGYEEPTPIQTRSIPPLLAGRDVLGQAATGTGKTAAFALPLLQRATSRRPPGTDAATAPGRPYGLVLAPTRELAVQVSEAMHRYGRRLGARVLPLYGGQPIGRQLRALAAGVDVVVATPGRALDHLGRGTLDLAEVATVVLDEADEMLDMGFAEDLDAILGALPDTRQTVLFSATLPGRISALAARHLSDPVRIEVGRAVAEGDAPLVRQTAYIVARAHKPAALGRVLDVEAPTAALVFCRTRDEVDQLTETLNGRGYRAEPLHGGMSQDQRERVLGRLRAGTADLIVATDVAARGLDVEHLTHVVNYDVPSAPEAYVHRIGRVGRAGRTGVAITLAEPREHRMLRAIERSSGQRIRTERLPTVADLQARRLDLLRAALEDALLEEDRERFRVVLDSLADEFDVVDIALAAMRLAHEATGGGDAVDEAEIPVAHPPRAESGGTPRGRDRTPGFRAPAERRGPQPGRSDEQSQRRPGDQRRAGREGDVARVFLNVGRMAGVRPQDLVGAIANEAGLPGRDVGAIEIGERHSLVEVPADAVDQVVSALRRATIRGRKVTARRDRGRP